MKCTFEDCGEEAKRRGLCNKHYLHAKNSGTIDLFKGPGAGRRAPPEVMDCGGVSQCGRKMVARGLCSACYQRKKLNGELENKPIKNSGKKCSVEGCDTGAKSLGMCIKHYERFRKYGDPKLTAPRKTGGKCSIEECDGEVIAAGLCSMHYARKQRNGDPLQVSDRYAAKFEKSIDSNGYVLVPKKGHKNAVRNGCRIPEHRLVMSEFLGRPLRKNENVHHINGDKTDNRIENLELWVVAQPKGQRPQDLVDFAKSILKKYGADSSKLSKLKYRNT